MVPIRSQCELHYGRADGSLIDEGSGIISSYNQTFAAPGVTEKGTVNLKVSVNTLGGHSSVPPLHTGIGLLSLVVAEIEKHPHSPTLPTYSPIYGFLQCSAAHASGLPEDLRHMVYAASMGSKEAINDLPKAFIKVGFSGIDVGPGQGDPLRALMSTTQATDIVSGGLKVNALVSRGVYHADCSPNMCLLSSTTGSTSTRMLRR